MGKRVKKKPMLRIPAQQSVDELVSMPWSQDVPDSSFDPFMQLSKQKRRFVSALIANYGSEVEAAKCAMNMFEMDDATAIENAFIFRSDPQVADAIKRATDYIISRRGELYLGSLRQAATIAATDPNPEIRLKAIQFLADNVGTGLEAREAQIASTAQGNNANGNGEGGQVQSLVELMKLSFAGGAAVGGVISGQQGQQGKSKMVPLDVEIQNKGE